MPANSKADEKKSFPIINFTLFFLVRIGKKFKEVTIKHYLGIKRSNFKKNHFF